MKFHHLRAFKISGFVLPSDTNEKILWRDEKSGDLLLITRDLDERAYLYDRRTALANLMLGALIGKSSQNSLTERVESEITNLRELRRSEFGLGPYLLLIEVLCPQINTSNQAAFLWVR